MIASTLPPVIAAAVLAVCAGACKGQAGSGQAGSGQWAVGSGPVGSGREAPGASAGAGGTAHKTPRSVGDGLRGAGPGSGTGTGTEKECNPTSKQTGVGCHMEGIRAAVRPELGPGGPVQGCYRKHLAAQPKEGKVLVRFSLTPEGRATGLQVARDDLGSKEMAQCLLQVLSDIAFPAPGDVPCQVVYPFSFFPKGG